MVRMRFLVAVQPIDSISAKDRIINDEAAELEKIMLPTARELKNIRKLRDDRAEAEYNVSVVVGMVSWFHSFVTLSSLALTQELISI